MDTEQKETGENWNKQEKNTINTTGKRDEKNTAEIFLDVSLLYSLLKISWILHADIFCIAE